MEDDRRRVGRGDALEPEFARALVIEGARVVRVGEHAAPVGGTTVQHRLTFGLREVAAGAFDRVLDVL